jgi:hypothetical protein
MTAISFNTPDELAKYVNDNTIAQATIVNISFKDGQWFLFHF